ncbi:MAG: hypothetical protein H0Z40_10910 [Desulfotomaculum sp.]|nr:hypothetical protein [Desulfotomaculum sp.]
MSKNEKWMLLFRTLRIDKNTVVFEKKSLNNDIFLGPLSGAMIPKTHIYVRSDIQPELEDYIRAHELCHHHLIFNKGYYFFMHEKGTEDPLFSIIMSFTHHFAIDKILHSCKFDIMKWHQNQYRHCKEATRKGFTSYLDTVGKTLNLIEADFWLKNNAINKLKKYYLKHDSRCGILFEYNDNILKEIIDKEQIFSPQGAKEALIGLHKHLKLPPAKIYCMKLLEEEI